MKNIVSLAIIITTGILIASPALAANHNNPVKTLFDSSLNLTKSVSSNQLETKSAFRVKSYNRFSSPASKRSGRYHGGFKGQR
ncbi:MAG: hypothetical protein AAGA76_12005 [Pseudomonadota bacterium]